MSWGGDGGPNTQSAGWNNERSGFMGWSSGHWTARPEHRVCHDGEPGCAIEAAIESGELEKDRYSQYLKLKQERLVSKARLSSRMQKQITAEQGRRGKGELMRKIKFEKRKVKDSKQRPWRNSDQD